MHTKTPHQQPENLKTNWRQFVRFLLHAKLSWPLILLATFASIAYYEVMVYLPGSTAALFSGDFSAKAITDVIINYACTLALTILTNLLSVYAQARSVRSVRNTIWKRMTRTRSEYYMNHEPSYLLSAVTSDVSVAVSSVISVVTMFIPMTYYLIRAVQTVGQYSVKLVFSLFLLLPLYLVYGFFFGKWQCKNTQRIQTRIGELMGHLTERIRNLSLIKSFSNEKAEEENGRETVKKLYKSKIRLVFAETISVGYTTVTDVLGTVLAVLWGSMLLKQQEIDLEEWMGFFLIAPTINLHIRLLVKSWTDTKVSQGYAARLGAMMEAPLEQDAQTQEAAPFAAGDIRLDNVAFSYGETPVLKSIDLVIPQGKSTALVGLSGCGKTTLLSLLERFYKPAQGRITIADTPIDDFDIQDYRRHFAYVQQDAGVFSGTVRDVITYGVHRPVTDAQIDEAAKLSGIYDFICTLPEKYETKMALYGSSFSGGQKQKLVIARELLKDADVLLFDEPTSALDAATTREIQNIILRVFKGKTVITISHDLSLIAAVDQIAVIHDGVVQACGTNEELMAKSQLYRELVEEQSYQEVFQQ